MSTHAQAFRMAQARGTTMVEAIISLVLVSVVVMVSLLVIRSTSDNMKFELVVVDQQNHTRATMDKMMEEIRRMSAAVNDFNTTTGANTNTVTGANVVDALTFTVPAYNYATNTANLGTAATAITYRWMSNPRETQGNGIDDDSNGLTDADDGQIQRLVGGAENTADVVCPNVPRSGFLVIKAGRRLQIRVTMINNTPYQTGDGTLISTAVTHNTYCLRNY